MKRLQPNLNLTGVIIVLAVGVLLPVLLSTAAGIISLVLARDTGGIIIGVLVVSFTVTATGCALIAVVLASRKARLAKWQSDIVANVSHEFRTPLSAIRLYTQTLQSGSLDGDPAQRAEFLATILRETERLDAMVNRMLTWRASSRNVIALKMESEVVTGAVEDALQRFRAMVPPDEVALEADTGSCRRVRHDVSAISAVVLNLLTNAHKYSDHERHLQLRVEDRPQHVAITVSDNGLGLTPREQKRIFKPFYRVRSGHAQDRGGMGLGLAIARYLVRRHSGTLSVTSEPGAGSTFEILLPVDAPT